MILHREFPLSGTIASIRSGTDASIQHIIPRLRPGGVHKFALTNVKLGLQYIVQWTFDSGRPLPNPVLSASGSMVLPSDVWSSIRQLTFPTPQSWKLHPIRYTNKMDINVRHFRNVFKCALSNTYTWIWHGLVVMPKLTSNQPGHQGSQKTSCSKIINHDIRLSPLVDILRERFRISLTLPCCSQVRSISTSIQSSVTQKWCYVASSQGEPQPSM
jgi:hypothetical protein